MKDLPLLLAGPIVRRAETTGIWIWIATSDRVSDVAPLLFRITGKSYDNIPLLPVSSETFYCAMLGDKLYVTLFRITPKEGLLPTNIFLGYSFNILTPSGMIKSPQSLSSLIGNIEDICYSPFELPTVYLQKSNGKLAQGSCRRPGAYGPDAFSDFDILLKSTCCDLKSRPAALFLTGDQIYADDVAYPLFKAIRSLAPILMGYEEEIPDVTWHGDWEDYVSADRIKYTIDEESDKNSRRPVLLRAGFTTDDGQGHLMTFGEFAAMYCLVWNPSLCRGYEVEKKFAGIAPIGTKNLENFCKAVHSARRVLANIPTYMAFDDHEITDDWNLNANWVSQTNNRLARRVLTNGLAAYWAFQGWGNAPNMRTVDPNTEEQIIRFIEWIEMRLIKFRNTGNIKPSERQKSDKEFEEKILYREPNDYDREPYAYVAPTKPPVIVTDMRTRRKFQKPTSLLNKDAYTHLEKICKGWPSNQPALIVSGTPILNWHPVFGGRDQMIADPSTMLTKIVKGTNDPEKLALIVEFGDIWNDHVEGRARLIRWIHDKLKPSYCVFFSGDVHHGSFIIGEAKMKDAKDKPDNWSLKILQITSSPIKNESPDLNDDPFGVPTANFLDYNFSTLATVDTSVGDDNKWMTMASYAVVLIGKLAEPPSKFKSRFMKFLHTHKHPNPRFHSDTPNGTAVFSNHVCVVDFSIFNVVSASFYGREGISCFQGVKTNVPFFSSKPSLPRSYFN